MIATTGKNCDIHNVLFTNDEQCEYIHYCKFYKTNTSNGNCNVNFTLLLFTIVE